MNDTTRIALIREVLSTFTLNCEDENGDRNLADRSLCIDALDDIANAVNPDLEDLEADGWISPATTARFTIVCLCGSTRFYDEFQQANYDLTMQGEIVLSVGFYPHAKARHGHGEGVGHDSTEKTALDELHKRKIDLADYVFVLNVGGYVGESTRSEIAYAFARGKPVRYLERDDTERVTGGAS
jgi:hypothetical protein